LVIEIDDKKNFIRESDEEKDVIREL